MTADACTYVRPPSPIHRGWRCALTIHDALNSYYAEDAGHGSTVAVAAISTMIHDRLVVLRDEGRDGWTFTDDTRLAEVIDGFHTIANDPDEHDPEREFDLYLNDLYDWADERRVLVQ